MSNKCQSRCKAKPTDSDADYTANEDSTDQDKLADDAEEAGVPGEAQAATEERGEEEEEDEAEEEEEECTASPKKAAKGAATGKAKAPPVAALLLLFRRSSRVLVRSPLLFFSVALIFPVSSQ